MSLDPINLAQRTFDTPQPEQLPIFIRLAYTLLISTNIVRQDIFMLTVLMVALGGAIGASSRYLLSLLIVAWFGSGLPVATLAVNALGSLLLGCLVEYGALSGALSTHWRGFLAVGVLGGFTTFSTFRARYSGLDAAR